MFNYRKYIVRVWTSASLLFVLFSVFSIFGFIFLKGYKSLTLEFLFSKPSGMPLGMEGGIFPAIIGTIFFGTIGTVSAFVAAISVSVYNQFYSQSRIYTSFINKVIGVINGIPSIVLGLFGYSYFVLYLGYGISVLSGGLVLGLMIFPNMEIRFEKVFSELDYRYKLAAFSLGVNRFYYLISVVFPLTFREILSAVTLSTSFAMGATAPIMLTGAVYFANTPKSIFSPAMALPMHLYMLLGESISQEKAFATACVLLILLLVINLASGAIATDWRHENG